MPILDFGFRIWIAGHDIRSASQGRLRQDNTPMSNKFYSPGEQRAEKVHELFDTIACRYDLMNDVMSFGMHRAWKRRVAKLAAIRPGERVLDVAAVPAT